MSLPAIERYLEQFVPKAAKLGVGYSEEQLKQWRDEAIHEERSDQMEFWAKIISVKKWLALLTESIKDGVEGRRLSVELEAEVLQGVLVPEFLQQLLDRSLKHTLEEGRMRDAKCLVDFFDAKVPQNVKDQLLIDALNKSLYYVAKMLMKDFGATISPDQLNELLKDALANKRLFHAWNLINDFGAAASPEQLNRSFVYALDNKLFDEAKRWIKFVNAEVVKNELSKAYNEAVKKGREYDVEILRNLGAKEPE